MLFRGKNTTTSTVTKRQKKSKGKKRTDSDCHSCLNKEGKKGKGGKNWIADVLQNRKRGLTDAAKLLERGEGKRRANLMLNSGEREEKREKKEAREPSRFPLLLNSRGEKSTSRG